MKTIENTLAFLERVDLKGKEVPAFNECVQMLQNLYREKSENKPEDLWIN